MAGVKINQAADAIWVEAIEKLGWKLRRDDLVYASWDGKDTLTICNEGEFDPTDCMAQMILHEIVHAIVQGPELLGNQDWGLENMDDRDLEAEYACHRLQAVITEAYGLRMVMRPATDHLPYYLALPEKPLLPEDRPALQWACQEPWAPVLEEALERTAIVARELADQPGTIWARFDETLDCRACGACCREGFDRVEVDDETLPGVQLEPFGPHIPRPGGKCVHLSREAPWTCAIYEQRPSGCSDLPMGGDSCWEARKRLRTRGVR
ncbi:MAG: YkgJ family cysteine cluster protein [Proteobacteria bacterium]|nr:YkgJ family cysteine cluster protein [Pseudomonadota bacterium]MCP4918683.1 YkgJ family cysteine cluster protein [Pseudomonadota bacterium]